MDSFLKQSESEQASSLEEEIAHGDHVHVDEEASLYAEVSKCLLKRLQLMATYFELASTHTKEQMKQAPPRLLPALRDAFSLQIPAELRHKIMLNSQQANKQNSICLGLSLNGAAYQFNSAASANAGYLTLKQAQQQINLNAARLQQQYLQKQRQSQQQQQQLQENQSRQSLSNANAKKEKTPKKKVIF